MDLPFSGSLRINITDTPADLQQVYEASMTHNHSIWLMPCAEDGEFLSGLLADFAGRFGTPVFTPHLTIRGDTSLAVAALEAGVTEVASDVPAFSEAITAIEASDTYFRSFYARFGVSAPLGQLKQRLDPGAAEAFLPHVSLLYGFIPVAAKASLAHEFQQVLAGRQITFDRLCVVRSGQDIPIDEWAVIATAQLAPNRR